MPETSSLLSMFGKDARRLASNLGEMFRARRQLAEMEIRADVANSKRLAIAGGIGLVAAMTGLPVLLSVVAESLNAWLPLSKEVNCWMFLLGGLSLVLGLSVMWWAWRRFRTDFVGLQESLDEVKEDVLWLREWVERTEVEDE